MNIYIYIHVYKSRTPQEMETILGSGVHQRGNMYRLRISDDAGSRQAATRVQPRTCDDVSGTERLPEACDNCEIDVFCLNKDSVSSIEDLYLPCVSCQVIEVGFCPQWVLFYIRELLLPLSFDPTGGLILWWSIDYAVSLLKLLERSPYGLTQDKALCLIMFICSKD